MFSTLIPESSRQGESPKLSASVSGVTDRLSRAFPSNRASISLREDFRLDLRNWQGAVPGMANGWSKVGNAVRVGEFRLWKPTLALSDL
jgi:hypothetical protein